MPSYLPKFLHDYGPLLGGAIGATLAFLFVGFKEFFARPRLHLDFDNTDEAHMSESTHPEGDKVVTRKYLRVSLTARGFFKNGFGGSSGAKKCRVYITSIQPIIGGKVSKDKIYDARPVTWPPNSDFAPRDIPRGVTMFVNVVTMKMGSLHWHFQVPNTYGLGDDTVSHSGSILIGLTATADNAKPVTTHVRASIKADKSGFEADKE
jgi:hypothetical protein